VLFRSVHLGGDASQNPVPAASSAPGNAGLSPARADNAIKEAARNAGAMEAQNRTRQELLAKIEQLRLAGNWQVFVLYATEWTRRDPENAAAWNDLSLGYRQLRQYDDAYDASKKAVTLAPGDPRFWRNLGDLDRALSLPEEALRAYDEAAALDDRDVHSLVQAGILNVHLGRLPEAKLALDKALAINPADSEALCLKAVVARPPNAGKDIVPASRRREPLAGSCREFAEREDGTVFASSLSVSKPPVAYKKP